MNCLVAWPGCHCGTKLAVRSRKRICTCSSQLPVMLITCTRSRNRKIPNAAYSFLPVMLLDFAFLSISRSIPTLEGLMSHQTYSGKKIAKAATSRSSSELGRRTPRSRRMSCDSFPFQHGRKLSLRDEGNCLGKVMWHGQNIRLLRSLEYVPFGSI